jgi:hypothetical protein
MELIKADRVRTVYVESQNRWGTKDRKELFTLLGVLCAHRTALYDLRAKMDLTKSDQATELLAMLNSFKSEQELKDIAYQSLRTRVNNFQATGSWPTGTHPYGYGKRCFSPDGKLLWEWQPVNRSQGQLFYPDGDGALNPVGPPDAKIPRKAKGQIIKLVPSINRGYVRAVKMVFDLYTRAGLSRRRISAHLNSERLTFNGGPFTHPDVTNILQNPAYAGDTYFGKVQTGELHTFDAKGMVVEVVGQSDDKRRAQEECLVKRDTHEALVDRKTFKLAQEKLADEQKRTSFSPRNPAYYLKQLLVCGHCGKGMAGQTEIDKITRKRTVVYICSSYVAGRCNGHPTACGPHRITHDDAERLLLDKIHELQLPFEATASEGLRAMLQARLERLGLDDEESSKVWEQWVSEGIDALADYLMEQYPEAAEWPMIQKLRKLAFYHYWEDLDGRRDEYRPCAVLPINMAELRQAVQEAEDLTAGQARQKLTELRQEHEAYTKNWVKATDAMQAVLKQEIERLEAEVREWEPRTMPLSERFKALYAAEEGREAERKKLLAEWPTLEARERGEALRRLFKTVTLFWEKTWHPRMSKPPKCRPRKTDRPGRWGYKLQLDRTGWAFACSDLETSW